ncbi:hypothetical protein PP604_07955 [Mycobacteroides abscessus]|nr:hypothetical protein [Mycobacteroides abscessus]MDM2652235.1 hypothetical protein [Mycobacteroides abscessus]MDM2662858.1 hypothetical protein [Mycobacteroides abscessus]MDM2667966.1 hypothetical protein [Mycobacteroides abscessus]MDM2673330.1 hypothetical protein [Mycobacteroides abscessus]
MVDELDSGGRGLTTPERWEPDTQMVAAVLSSPKSFRKMTEMCDQDRAWLVAGLTAAGMTAQDIAARTGCSLRLIRAIRAEDMTQAFVVAQREAREVSDELRLERIELTATRHEADQSRAEAARLRTQIDQLIDAHLAGTLTLFRCGHAQVKYNVYEHGGRKFCRECARLRKQEHRKSKRLAAVS